MSVQQEVIYMNSKSIWILIIIFILNAYYEQSGNDYKIVMSQWEDLFATQPDPETANYNLDVLTDFRAKRFQESVANNPYFFNGPFSGVLVQPAAYTFIYRFMANKSAEAPEVSALFLAPDEYYWFNIHRVS